MSQTVFYVFGLLVVAIILLAGGIFFTKSSEKHDQLLLTQFEQQFKNDVKRLGAEYGYIQTLKYDLPSAYKQVCFLDVSQKNVLLDSPSLTDYPAIRDAATTSNDNVFVAGKSLYGFSAENLTLLDYPYYRCLNIQYGQFEVTLEGAGQKILLLTNLTTGLTLDSSQEQHLFSADGLIELVIPPGTIAYLGGETVKTIEIQIIPLDTVAGSKGTEVYRFGPEGTVFSQPIQLKMQYFPALVGSNCPTTFEAHSFKDDGTSEATGPSLIKIDCQSHIATFNLYGFSIIYGGGGSCSLLCFDFMECGPTGIQPRLCYNPNNCLLDSASISDLATGSCEGYMCSETADCDPCLDKDNDRPCQCAEECQSNNCESGTCQDLVGPPTCTDGFKNEDETDVDCGGTCDPCADGLVCVQDPGCAHLMCDGGKCVSCVDGGLPNQDETDVDCGGSACDPCADGQSCDVKEDCQSQNCLGGICKPSCTETAGCDTCLNKPNGQTCDCADECQSTNCDGGVCQGIMPPSCTDSVKNQDETDVDCGGSSCPKCADKKSCLADPDCVNNKCDINKCVSCSDTLKNQGEGDADCGGPCAKCKDGQSCNSAADCQSNNCESGTCQAAGGSTTVTFTNDKSRGGWANVNEAHTGLSWANIGRGPFNLPADPEFKPRRDFLYFDTGTIPATATIISATLTLQGPNYAGNGCTPNVGNIDIYKCNFDPLDKGDFSTICSKNPSHITLKGIATSTVNLQSDFITKAGKTQLRLQTQNEACTTGTNQNYARLCIEPPGWDQTKCTYKPTLTITYSS